MLWYGLPEIENIPGVCDVSANLSKLTILGRLMASENITISFDDGNDIGGSFDTKKRVVHLSGINLGKYNDAEVEGVLIHEIGHARYTSDSDWKGGIEQLVKATGCDKAYAVHVLNVVEDARIERKMEELYAGVNRAFVSLYRSWVVDRNGWNIIDPVSKQLTAKIKQSPFCNRLNIQFKVGQRIPSLGLIFSGWEKSIVDRCQTAQTFSDVYKISLEIVKNNPNGMPDGESNPNSDDDGGSSSDAQNDSDWREVPCHAGEEPNGTESQDGQDASGSSKVVSAGKLVTKAIKKEYKQPINGFSVHPGWAAQHNKHVAGMVQRFLMKQSSRVYRSVNLYETGEIDTALLPEYRTAVSITRQSEEIPVGKNHGFFVLVDLSGSMSRTISKVFENLAVHLKFFDKIGVPYEVWGFTDTFSLSMIHIASSSFSAAKKKNHFAFLTNFNQGTAFDHIKTSDYFSMGGTPLAGAIAATVFDPTYFGNGLKSVDKLNFLMFTDGGAEDADNNGVSAVWDETGWKAYGFNPNHSMVDNMLTIMKKKYPISQQINFFLDSEISIDYLSETFTGLKEIKSGIYKGNVLDALIAIKPNQSNFLKIMNFYIDMIA